MINLIGNILCSAIRNLFENQPDIFNFTPHTGETEWNLGHHLANEIHKYIFWLNCDLDLTKRNYSNRRPDIVFHRRGIHKLNFLVVELKHHDVSNDEDIRRITEDWMGSHLYYRFGASIKIKNEGEYEVIVFHEDHEGKFNQTSRYIPLEKPISAEKLIAVAEQILTAKQKDPNADTSALEKQIDDIVYQLYGLTSEEIAIVEGKI